MAKSIANGVNKIVEIMGRKEAEQQDIQWRQLRNRIDSILMQTNILKTDEVRKCCQIMDNMTHDERVKHITEKWGTQYLHRVEPMLHQLNTLEAHINSAK